MTRKSRVLYESALNRLLDVCFEQTGRRPSPELLISDYELAILEAAATCFPTGRARGCWYHSGNVGCNICIKLNIYSMNYLLLSSVYRPCIAVLAT